MIQKIVKRMDIGNDPVYIEYLNLLRNSTKTFYSSYFLAKVNDKTFKVTFPTYVNIDIALDNSKSARESVELQYMNLLYKDKLLKDLELLNIHIKKYDMGCMYYIDKLPTIVETQEKVQIIKSDKKSKRQTKIKKNVINEILLGYPFNMFNFKSKEECNSRETSKPYYISKKEMVDVITNNNDLKQMFPKGYKTLKKEELCKVVFEKIDSNP